MAVTYKPLVMSAATSAEKFRLAFETAPLSMVVSTQDGIILDGNRAVLELSGYAREEFVGRPVSMLYAHPEERSELLARLRTMGRVAGALLTFRKKDGSLVLGRVHMEPFRLNGGTALFSAVEDLTAMAQVHERLAESAERYRLLFQHAHDAIFLTDVDGLIVDANPAAQRLFEVSSTEMRHVNVRELFADAADHAAVLAGLAAQGHVTDMTLRLRSRSGRPFTVSLNANHWRDAAGCVVGTQGSVRDISDRVRAETELATTVQLLRAVIDASPLAIIGTDLDTRITLWNPAAERLYGYSSAEVLGKEATLLLDSPEALAAYVEQRRATLAGAPPRGVVMPRRRKDGSTFLASLSFAPVQADGGTATGIMVVAEDVTERRLIEDRLRRSQKLEAIGRLAGGVAHDFNNVLTVVMAEASSIRTAVEPGSEVDRSAAEIEGAARRAAGLTRQLLAFSRRQPLAPSVTDVNEIVREAERMLSRLIKENVRITVRLAPALWQIRAEPTQLHQVLLNLCINARDAMPDGGTLRIETQNVTARAPTPTVDGTLSPGEYVRLQVADTGGGMDDTTLAHAFEPFFTTKDRLGTGLGLPTVLGIVNQSGGGLALETRPGGGTTFSLYFPRHEETAAASAS